MGWIPEISLAFCVADLKPDVEMTDLQIMLEKCEGDVIPLTNGVQKTRNTLPERSWGETI